MLTRNQSLVSPNLLGVCIQPGPLSLPLALACPRTQKAMQVLHKLHADSSSHPPPQPDPVWEKKWNFSGEQEINRAEGDNAGVRCTLEDSKTKWTGWIKTVWEGPQHTDRTGAQGTRSKVILKPQCIGLKKYMYDRIPFIHVYKTTFSLYIKILCIFNEKNLQRIV